MSDNNGKAKKMQATNRAEKKAAKAGKKSDVSIGMTIQGGLTAAEIKQYRNEGTVELTATAAANSSSTTSSESDDHGYNDAEYDLSSPESEKKCSAAASGGSCDGICATIEGKSLEEVAKFLGITVEQLKQRILTDPPKPYKAPVNENAMGPGDQDMSGWTEEEKEWGWPDKYRYKPVVRMLPNGEWEGNMEGMSTMHTLACCIFRMGPIPQAEAYEPSGSLIRRRNQWWREYSANYTEFKNLMHEITERKKPIASYYRTKWIYIAYGLPGYDTGLSTHPNVTAGQLKKMGDDRQHWEDEFDLKTDFRDEVMNITNKELSEQMGNCLMKDGWYVPCEPKPTSMKSYYTKKMAKTNWCTESSGGSHKTQAWKRFCIAFKPIWKNNIYRPMGKTKTTETDTDKALAACEEKADEL